MVRFTAYLTGRKLKKATDSRIAKKNLYPVVILYTMNLVKVEKALGTRLDIRANCFRASLLRTKIHTPRHALSVLSNKMNNDRADGHCYSFAWI